MGNEISGTSTNWARTPATIPTGTSIARRATWKSEIHPLPFRFPTTTVIVTKAIQMGRLAAIVQVSGAASISALVVKPPATSTTPPTSWANKNAMPQPTRASGMPQVG